VYNHLKSNHFKTDIYHSLHGSQTWSLEKNTAGTCNCSKFYEQINFCSLSVTVSRDSAIGTATSYWLDDRGVGVRVPVRSRIFSSTCRSDRIWGSPNLLSNGYWGLFPQGAKRQGREADRSPPTSAKVKKTWVYTSTHLYAFMA
jgi:hypothetical protein